MSHSHGLRLIMVLLLVSGWSGASLFPQTPLSSMFSPGWASSQGADVAQASNRNSDTELQTDQVAKTLPETSLLGLTNLPVYFVKNQGQFDKQVKFSVLGGHTQVFFTQDGVTFVLSQPGAEVNQTTGTDKLPSAGLPQSSLSNSGPINSGDESTPRSVANSDRIRWVVKLNFIGAQLVDVVGEDESTAVVSYFGGASEQWETALPTYQQVVYHDLWAGIDLAFQGQAGQLKYEFIVHPGADPTIISLQYSGAQRIRLDEQDNLEVSTPLGAFVDQAPSAWQVSEDETRPVEVQFSLSEDRRGSALSSSLEGASFGFALGEYDPTQELVIDPAVVVQSGYLGGLYYDVAEDITLDTAGNIYITGETTSDENTFPVTVGPDLTHNLNVDAFVAKYNPSGTALIYAGYIGGMGNDWGWGIAVDDDQNVYIAGDTMSAADTFPALIGPFLNIRGPMDGFVAKINPAGTSLLYCGYIGGHAWDHAFDIAVDGTGSAYVVGSAGSDEGSFPVVVGPDLTFNGIDDGYIAKVNSDGSGFVYAGYIGGNNWDRSDGVAVDGAGNAYVVGQAKSNEMTFPILIGPDMTHNGDYDAFIVKVNPTGEALVYAGYIGGLAEDKAWDVVLDSDGDAYVVGETASSEASFPVLVGPDLSYNGGEKDAFVAKVVPSGIGLSYCGYIGGSEADFGHGIAIDGTGSVYITGYTGSDQSTFPVLNGPDRIYNGGPDAFISKLEPSGAQLLYSGYIGGAGADYGIAIIVDADGNAFVSGGTRSDQNSFPVWRWLNLTYNGDMDGFITKVSVLFRYFVPITRK